MDVRYRGVEIDFGFADYARCVSAAGGIPVTLPYEAAGREVVERLDALLLTGGQDVHPSYWGGECVVDPAKAGSHGYDHARDRHEIDLALAAVESSIPLLGVCRGHQVLNIALGGTLIADLAAPHLNHYSEASAPDNGPADHAVSFIADSLAWQIYGPRIVRNSWHHQSIDRPGSGLIATGFTDDGVVESVELPDRPVLGVQWHPEWQTDGDPVFDWLIAAARHPVSASDRIPLLRLNRNHGS
ncbi:gamma-glutamyl-gamma-aminobutyrate hydrolase family protein [Rhodococcus wratislaviensis]|uniref:gamma-glutamyl-gamma-aminobutyrate hydrolase family protein n=1 Tax=Rhodococcus wratislaviensis TaxID=44752 RepID=UPI003656E189